MGNTADTDANVDAVNQDFKQFDQVEKRQRYRLSESVADEEFDEEFQIRTCDMAVFFSRRRGRKTTIRRIIRAGHGGDWFCGTGRARH